jgi:phosphoribosyl-AMP cyclohydrolase
MATPIPSDVESIFDRGELVAAIAQDIRSSEVLMLAWMNREALTITLETGRVTYWSRSRSELWEKGASSGHSQKLCKISYDCDGDALLLKVEQTGAACHTGSHSCFSRDIPLNSSQNIEFSEVER